LADSVEKVATEHGMILDVEATPANRTAEVDLTKTMVERVEAQYNLTPNRKIVRSLHEAARDVARRIAKTAEYIVSRCERKKVEMLFAHLKRIMKLDRLRLRGLTGATDEFTLAATVRR
jgi:hypothetical protein